MRIIVLSLFLTSIIYSQSTVYEIPFASKGNKIELTVENKSNLSLQNIKVEAIDLPNWINFTEEEQIIKDLKGNGEVVVTFKFKVEKEAPAREETKLKFHITNSKTRRKIVW